MMERFEWVRGKSARLLAAEWGLAVATVEGNAAEASRTVTGDADEARRDITVGARKLLRQAVDQERPGDFAKIADVWAMVSGAKAPERHEVSAGIAVNPSEAARLVREAFGERATPKDPDASRDPKP